MTYLTVVALDDFALRSEEADANPTAMLALATLLQVEMQAREKERARFMTDLMTFGHAEMLISDRHAA